jgi:hypothetical protein
VPEDQTGPTLAADEKQTGHTTTEKTGPEERTGKDITTKEGTGQDRTTTEGTEQDKTTKDGTGQDKITKERTGQDQVTKEGTGHDKITKEGTRVGKTETTLSADAESTTQQELDTFSIKKITITRYDFGFFIKQSAL